MKKYVLGFAFDRNKRHVVLIEKGKPDWQKGKHNGVGGKVEPEDESISDAMIREFMEETGVKTETNMWHHFATMIFKNDIMGGGAEVYCFRMFSNSIYQVKTIETEPIKIFSLFQHADKTQRLNEQVVIKNLNVLIPMALDEDFQFAELDLK